MDTVQLVKKLQQPNHIVDVILDTDAYNEVDDQYAISYLLSCTDKVRVRALYAAPFLNNRSVSAEEGMEKSYDEILHLLNLIDREDMRPPVFRGSRHFLTDEKTPEISPAAEHLCQLAMEHSVDDPLYVVGIGAATNLASAILMQPEIIDRLVVIWQGGNALHWPNAKDFNLIEDIAAARVLFTCGVPLVHFPAFGVVSALTISEAELNTWLKGQNDLCDYLVDTTVADMTKFAGKPWTRIIWDIAAVSWLTGNFTDSYLIPSPIPQYDRRYSVNPAGHQIRYVYYIKRDELVQDLFARLGSIK